MRGMILAAGRGERMGVLTQETPKPLLRIGDRLLIEFAIQQLKSAGIVDIVINISYLANQIQATVGNGQRYGVNIHYSEEAERLETGGGIVKALPLLGDDPFVVVSGDVICDYPLASLPLEPAGLAHLVLVENPDFHRQGDFGLEQEFVAMQAKPTYTFANMGVYRKELFRNAKVERFPLNQLLFPAIANRQVTGELFRGKWFNVGDQNQLTRASSYSYSRHPAACPQDPR